MHLDHRTAQRPDAVVKGYTRVGVGAGIEHHAVKREPHFLQLIDKLTLNVALIIAYLHVGKLGPQPGQIALEALAAIDSDRKSTRLNSSHANISYAVFCLKKNTHYH